MWRERLKIQVHEKFFWRYATDVDGWKLWSESAKSWLFVVRGFWDVVWLKSVANEMQLSQNLYLVKLSFTWRDVVLRIIVPRPQHKNRKKLCQNWSLRYICTLCEEHISKTNMWRNFSFGDMRYTFRGKIKIYDPCQQNVWCLQSIFVFVCRVMPLQ